MNCFYDAQKRNATNVCHSTSMTLCHRINACFFENAYSEQKSIQFIVHSYQTLAAEERMWVDKKMERVLL